jgi:hypothetical protein
LQIQRKTDDEFLAQSLMTPKVNESPPNIQRLWQKNVSGGRPDYQQYGDLEDDNDTQSRFRNYPVRRKGAENFGPKTVTAC